MVVFLPSFASVMEDIEVIIMLGVIIVKEVTIVPRVIMVVEIVIVSWRNMVSACCGQ